MICPNIGGGSGGEGTGGDRFLRSGTQQLEFQIYSNSGRTTIWGSSLWPYTPRPPKLTVGLGLFGSGTQSWTIYGRVFGSQGTVPSGSYMSSFAGGHVSFRVRYNDSSNCNSTIGTVSASQPGLVATATVASTCTVSTTDLDFGTVGVLSSPVDATGSVRVNCSAGTPWEIDLVVPTGETASARKLNKGAETVTFGTYRNSARSQPWGDATGQSVTGTGTGSQQSIPVYGRVPAQATPSAGTYTDTIIVNVLH